MSGARASPAPAPSCTPPLFTRRFVLPCVPNPKPPVNALENATTLLCVLLPRACRYTGVTPRPCFLSRGSQSRCERPTLECRALPCLRAPPQHPWHPVHISEASDHDIRCRHPIPHDPATHRNCLLSLCPPNVSVYMSYHARRSRPPPCPVPFCCLAIVLPFRPAARAPRRLITARSPTPCSCYRPSSPLLVHPPPRALRLLDGWVRCFARRHTRVHSDGGRTID
ncbi:hypothetical protein C8R46DRAFT_499445 [Mycena filopes]|nr:hypothetical protein C8R46DRAFT_499445 [Mycena filopes]